MVPTSVCLTVIQGGLKGQEFGFVAPAHCVVGRAGDCDIQVPSDCLHADVSRHHCALDIDPPVIHVLDLGSRNGTFVNGVRIDGPHRQAVDEWPEGTVDPGVDLKNGDQLRLGSVTFEVKVDEALNTPMPLLFV
jgi:pSer/pThr/pTyr-binding forkhead associated (FHA) protein